MIDFKERPYQLYQGDCLVELKHLPDASVDLILADPPYGTTACKWDTVIPLAPMWEQLLRVVKPNGAIVLTACQPFTSVLVTSNLKMFRYSLVWEKTTATGHLNSKRMPLRAHEDILVFYKKLPTYNPQMTHGHERKSTHRRYKGEKLSEVYGWQKKETTYSSTSRYPRSVIKTSTDKQRSTLHPTQKPEALTDYLVRTYSNESDVVLDFTMGSGTTGVSAIKLGRLFVGIEKDRETFAIADGRIGEVYTGRVLQL